MSLDERVRIAVGAVTDPELRRPLADLDMLREITVVDGHARVGIALTIVGCPAATRIEREVSDAAASVTGVASVSVVVGVMTPDERRALTDKLRAGRQPRTMPFGPDSLTRVIAVSSGKGGVGKSTVTANLAVALAQRGIRVGLLDADVHGFSIPGLLGIPAATTPTRIDDMILPAVAHDVKVISIGMFLPEAEQGAAAGAVAWRGPMLHRTVAQFLTDVYWGDLDVLLIDMPPGTGDVAISVGQLLPHAEVVVVTTPQSAAADVAVRSGLVARQTGQRVVGVVETMSPATLADGTVLDLFGSGGGDAVARALAADPGADAASPELFVVHVPLSAPLRQGGDAGVPVVVGVPGDPAAAAINTVADNVRGLGRGLGGRSLPFRTR